MPGYRQRMHFQQTDDFTRDMVIRLRREGWSFRQIAADTNQDVSTVHRLWRRCQRIRAWRRRGERSNPAVTVERPNARQRGIMVWGAIAYDSTSPLVRIQGTLNAQRYVQNVLRPVAIPYLQGLPNAIFQQDNARPHTARISQHALRGAQMLPWPLYSPDLSPIEHA
ncbi:transposable element Tcb2 transposase [Trichonephila clavipes]|nr:transposable element Tcb2 transposase [Trichonephila clavipes]